VLIVADDATAREVYAELFAMRGYKVVAAPNAREGLRRARDRKIGVVVVAMANGGAQLRSKLQALRPKLRVHVTGLLPPAYDVMVIPARQHLH
jgi:DNA-binding NtrC family response regulator